MLKATSTMAQLSGRSGGDFPNASLKVTNRTRDSWGFSTYKGRYGDVDVVVKQVDQSELVARSRIIPAADAAATLEHPHVVKIFGHVTWNDSACFISEHLQGETLGEHLSTQDRPLPPEKLGRWLSQIVDGLNYLEEAGATPLLCTDSIVIHPKSGRLNVKIMDPTAATYIRIRVAVQNRYPGILWFAPEMLRQESCDFQSQVWSFGVVLFQMVTLESPYSEMHRDYSIDRVVDEIAKNRLRPMLPRNASPVLRDLLVGCCQYVSQDRVNFASIRSSLIQHQSTDNFKSLLEGCDTIAVGEIPQWTPSRGFSSTLPSHESQKGAGDTSDLGTQATFASSLKSKITKQATRAVRALFPTREVVVHEASSTSRKTSYVGSFMKRLKQSWQRSVDDDISPTMSGGSGGGFTTRTTVVVPSETGVGLRIDFYGDHGNTGILVSSIDPQGVAAKAGNIFVGDVIVGVDEQFLLGRPISELQAVMAQSIVPGRSVVLKLAPLSQVYQFMIQWLGITPEKPPASVVQRQPRAQTPEVFSRQSEEDPDLKEFLDLESRIESGAIHTPPSGTPFGTANGFNLSKSLSSKIVNDGAAGNAGAFDEMHRAVQQLRKSILVLDHEISSDITNIEYTTMGRDSQASDSKKLDAHQTQAVARAVHSENIDFVSGTLKSGENMKDIIRRTARREKEKQERDKRLGIQEEDSASDNDDYVGSSLVAGLDDWVGPSSKQNQAASSVSGRREVTDDHGTENIPRYYPKSDRHSDFHQSPSLIRRQGYQKNSRSSHSPELVRASTQSPAWNSSSKPSPLSSPSLARANGQKSGSGGKSKARVPFALPPSPTRPDTGIAPNGPKVLGFVTTSHFNPAGSHSVNEKHKYSKETAAATYTCKHCGYRSDSADQLRTHERAKHPSFDKSRTFALSAW